jgi:hypothetical protein
VTISSPQQSPGVALNRPTDDPSDMEAARIMGVLFLITLATSIPALLLYDPVLDGTNFITGTGSEASVLVGAFLEVLVIIANIGTAVVLFPILKRQSETLALGYVTARIVECIFIAVGILALLAIVTLRQDIAGDANPATLDAL